MLRKSDGRAIDFPIAVEPDAFFGGAAEDRCGVRDGGLEGKGFFCLNRL